MYAFNDFQIRMFLSAFALAIESIIWQERRGKSPHTLSAYLFTFISRETSCYDLATDGILQEKFVSYVLLARDKLILSNKIYQLSFNTPDVRDILRILTNTIILRK